MEGDNAGHTWGQIYYCDGNMQMWILLGLHWSKVSIPGGSTQFQDLISLFFSDGPCKLVPSDRPPIFALIKVKSRNLVIWGVPIGTIKKLETATHKLREWTPFPVLILKMALFFFLNGELNGVQDCSQESHGKMFQVSALPIRHLIAEW